MLEVRVVGSKGGCPELRHGSKQAWVFGKGQFKGRVEHVQNTPRTGKARYSELKTMLVDLLKPLSLTRWSMITVSILTQSPPDLSHQRLPQQKGARADLLGQWPPPLELLRQG